MVAPPSYFPAPASGGLASEPGQPAGSEADVGDVDVAEEVGPLDPVLIEQPQALDDVPGPVQVEPVVPGQPLDRLQGEDVALRVAAPVGRGPVGHDQTEVLVHHQRARVGLEDLRGDTDGVDGLVESDRGGRGCGSGGGCGGGPDPPGPARVPPRPEG